MADEQIINETANPTLNTSSIEKMLPKYCTSVQVTLLNNAQIVLSMSLISGSTTARNINRARYY